MHAARCLKIVVWGSVQLERDLSEEEMQVVRADKDDSLMCRILDLMETKLHHPVFVNYDTWAPMVNAAMNAAKVEVNMEIEVVDSDFYTGDSVAIRSVQVR